MTAIGYVTKNENGYKGQPKTVWTDCPLCKFEMGAHPATLWSVVGRCGTSCRSELSRVWGITLKRREGHEARFSQTSR
jgi:hypothetical protein